MQTLTVPPMAEGIDTHDGQVYLANESVSNLYLLGKFFGGSYVYSFPTSQAKRSARFLPDPAASVSPSDNRRESRNGSA